MKKLLSLILLLILSCEKDTVAPDTTAPTVAITYPANGSTLTAADTIRVDVADESEIISVKFLIDGTEAYADSSAPYEYVWDVCVQGTDNHTVLVKAEDSAGNQGQSDVNTYTINASYDCALVCGGDNILDDCDVCDTDTANDCTCVPDSSNDCVKDCANVWGGDAVEDNCSTCDSDSSNDCMQDCAGTWGGELEEDECGVCEGDGSTCISDIDGNYYQFIQIGDQFWMAENLKVIHYNNGDEITHIINDADWGSYEEGQYGTYDNDPSNSDIYGNLYNWIVASDDRGVCPEGWHVPSDEEFMELEIFLGMSEEEANSWDMRVTNEGSKLAGDADLWKDGSLENNSEFGSTGFTARPGGFRFAGSGSIYYVGEAAYIWSSTLYPSTNTPYGMYRTLEYNSSKLGRYGGSKAGGNNIRCLKD